MPRDDVPYSSESWRRGCLPLISAGLRPALFVTEKDRQRWTVYRTTDAPGYQQGFRVVDRTRWGRRAGEFERYRIALRRVERIITELQAAGVVKPFTDYSGRPS